MSSTAKGPSEELLSLLPLTCNACHSRLLSCLTAISWEGYSRAGLISASDVQLIQKASKASVQQDQGDEFVQLHIRLLHDLNRNEAISYVLVLLADMHESPSVAQASPEVRQQLYDNLVPLISNSQDDFIRCKTAAILAGLLASGNAHPPIAPLKQTLGALLAMLHIQAPQEQWDVETQMIALQAMAQLFKKAEARQWVWSQRSSFVPAYVVLLALYNIVLIRSCRADLKLSSRQSSRPLPNNLQPTLSQLQGPPRLALYQAQQLLLPVRPLQASVRPRPWLLLAPTQPSTSLRHNFNTPSA